MNKPKVSIIIPCRNEVKYIAKNIDSILSQNYTGEIEVLVVDGFSDDGTRDLIKKYDHALVKLIDNPNKFTPDALNIGVDAAEGDIFIILGGHAYLEESFVKLNVEALQKDKSVGCAGGKIVNIFENETGAIISKAMGSVFGVGNATFRTGGKTGYVDTVAFGAYYKKVHYEIGKFDEDLVRNQDDEYNYKVNKAGYKIFFNPDITSYYYVRGSIKKLFKQYYQYGYWKVYVNKKHGTITTVRQLVPMLFVLGLLFGVFISLLVPLFWWIMLLGVSMYAALALYFGQKVSDHFTEGLKISSVFPILHFSYGSGYLKGIYDFIFIGKKPSQKSKTTSRG
ncbi:glycosyltransferase family 2 protein [Putridiphycobacter roseus]|uniref:glycosyltransferase family 2 protein n=1 Tax=Putridiphycobacter roseus TaxID=2219161 RepID=UPI0018F27372|nr:glycosyltransferase family 2 protein [Putridiphycobacter roseus]